MIVFGFSESPREDGPLNGACSHCNEQSVVAMKSYRYFHLFFLPVIPLGAKKGTTCTHCKQTQWGNEARDALNFGEAISDPMARRPFWHFIGPAFVFALIAFVSLEGDTDREIRSAAAAASPMVGDVWIVNMPEVAPDAETEYKFAVARIDKVEGDNIFLGFSDWQYEGWFGALMEAKKATRNKQSDYFTTTGLWFNRSEVETFEQARSLIWAFAENEVE
ncbi:MAG: hypothetical protein DHS20C05_17600 [Hyphococcus sp.]|nr:MAG: hypothetical protein DHS20C05_17600 [Marinicaulis sp.]